MRHSAMEAVKDSEGIVAGKKANERAGVVSKLNGSRYVVDLAKVVSNTKTMDDYYERICP